MTVDSSADTLEKLQKNAEPKTKETIMNAAQRLIQQGMQQGIQQEKLEIAKQMLQDGESMEKIQKWTGLSETNINALK